MFKITAIILFIIASSVIATAQSGKDAVPVFPAISTFNLFDVKEQKNSKITGDDKDLSLFVFLSPECPLSQNYTIALNKLHEKFRDKVSVYGIIPGNAYTPKEVMAFEDKYHINFRLLIDVKQNLTKYLKASITPQVILVDNKGVQRYTGAIDDWVISLGKKRLHVTRNYVQDAIEQSMQHETVKIKKTDAIGCKINDY